MTKNDFINEIEQFLRLTGLDATSFGKQAMNDSHFVHQIKQDRNPTLGTVEKCREFMREYGKE